MKTFKTGIIGLGTVSRTHRNALAQLDHVELTAVSDVKPEKKDELPEGVHFYQDYEEMLDQEQLDAVHICLPHYLHLPAVTACAKRGINVLLEKPSTMNTAELRQMQALDREYGFKLAVCFQNRLNPTFVKLRELIGSGEYGKLLGVKGVAIWPRNMGYYNAAPWRASMAQAGGGCMINQAIHTLDQLQLLGGPIRSVNGQVCNLALKEIEVEDTAVAHIDFENGVTGTFFGTVTYVKNSSIEVQAVCEKGSFTIKDYGLYYAPAENENEKTLLVRDRRLPGSKTYYGASHVELIRGFYETLAGHEDTCVSIQEDKVISLIEAIRRSSLEGRTILWKEMEEQ